VSGGSLVAALVVGVPALIFVLWPLLVRGPRRAVLMLPADGREQLLERKHAAVRALRELGFEHETGHLSDADYAELRARHEAEAAMLLHELDQLGEHPEPSAATTPEVSRPRRGWRHPIALGATAAALVVFGIAIGAGIVRHTAPDPSAASAPAPPVGPVVGPGAPPASGPASRPIAPDMLVGMLNAARASLREGRYGEAIAAYQAILKRDPENVDAMTHLALIVAMGGHADTALETLDRALSIDADYLPALLYRGQVLYEAKKDAAGAIKSWERFLAVAPPGDDRNRVAKLIEEARAAQRR
jgi:tetratricopeptide (TPR) repeat protein